MTGLIVGIVLTLAADIPVHGHRGARFYYPDNTIKAFEYAIDHGADWIELDLWATKDNALVVIHDPAVDLKVCRGPADHPQVIRTMNLEAVRQWDCGARANSSFPKQIAAPGSKIPLFDEVLALASRGSFRFNVEIKSDPVRPELAPSPDKYAPLVIDAIRKRKLEDRVMIQSFDWRLLHATEKIDPRIPRSALFPSRDHNREMNYVDIAKEANVKMVSVHYNTVTSEKVLQAHAAGIKVIAWTANEPEVWEKLVAAKVDEIITDDPAGLVAWLKSRGLHQ